MAVRVLVRCAGTQRHMISNTEDGYARLCDIGERIFESCLKSKPIRHHHCGARHHLHIPGRWFEIVRVGPVRNDDNDTRHVPDDFADHTFDGAVRHDNCRQLDHNGGVDHVVDGSAATKARYSEEPQTRADPRKTQTYDRWHETSLL